MLRYSRQQFSGMKSENEQMLCYCHLLPFIFCFFLSFCLSVFLKWVVVRSSECQVSCLGPQSHVYRWGIVRAVYCGFPIVVIFLSFLNHDTVCCMVVFYIHCCWCKAQGYWSMREEQRMASEWWYISPESNWEKNLYAAGQGHRSSLQRCVYKLISSKNIM